MANDVVVVASDIPATREMLGPRQVCATENQAMQLLREILVKPALRQELLKSQRERRVNYSARRMAGEWRTVYERVVSPIGARGARTGLKPAAVRGSRLDRRSRRYGSEPEPARSPRL
jgi:hypothetical protein